MLKVRCCPIHLHLPIHLKGTIRKEKYDNNQDMHKYYISYRHKISPSNCYPRFSFLHLPCVDSNSLCTLATDNTWHSTQARPYFQFSKGRTLWEAGGRVPRWVLGTACS